MKKLADKYYENLTPKQRVVATLEAIARDDAAEQERLVKTCPKRTYRATDAAYCDEMTKIIGATVSIECDLRGQAIAFLMCIISGNENDIDPHIFLQNIANMRHVWHDALEGMGVDAAVMDKIKPTNPFMDFMYELAPPP